MPQDESAPILALVRDLLFSSKITAEARAAEISVKIVRDPSQLFTGAQSAARLLLVDLELPGALEAAAAWKSQSQFPACGFVSHVDSATMATARKGGIDAMPRSRFVQILPELIRSAGRPT